MPDNIEVTSPTTEKPGDAKTKEGNLTMGQAAAQLFAKAEKAEQQQPVHQATEEKAKPAEESETTPEKSVAETAQVSESTPTEEKPTVETTETPVETEDGADAVHSQKSQFTPEQQEIFNKRLGKEIAKTKAIEAQMEEAKTRLAELEAKLSQPTEPPTPVPVVVLENQPLAEHNDFASLQKLHQSAKEAIRFVEETLDNPRAWKTKTVTDPDTGEETTMKLTTIGKETYTEADLKASARKARITLEDQIPQRAQFLTAREAAQKAAAAEFPWLKDKSSPEYQMAQAARRDPGNAAILAQPNADWIIGVQIEGIKALEARKAAAKAPPPKPKAPPPKPANDQAVVSTSAASVRQPIGASERQAWEVERVRLSKKGGISSEDAVKFLQQSELLRKSR